jgi:hypothetical protein
MSIKANTNDANTDANSSDDATGSIGLGDGASFSTGAAISSSSAVASSFAAADVSLDFAPSSAPAAAAPDVAPAGIFAAVNPAATSAVGTAAATATAPAASAAAPAAAAAASTVATTVPSWVNTLHTASIAADMAAADVGGTVTYAGLEKLLTDLDSTLSSTKTTLTSAEMSDLKTIVANLNNGMQTSTYLTSVMNSLVNGNSDNATWTGGAATSSTLGNLAVGSSATQLSDLIGKWVLGTDLPSSKVSVDGESFSVSYSASTKPLFAASGPSMNDVNQGQLGDCFLLASLAEVADQNAGDISSMFTSNGNNTYGVRFYVDGKAEYVTVNNSLADGGSVFNSGSDIWASLAEKAYTQLQAGGNITGGFTSDGNSYSTIGNGGAVECALEEITGASQITDFVASGSSWYDITYNSSLSFTGLSSSTTSSVLSTLEYDLAKGDDLVLSSYTNATQSGKTTLVADHAMSIYGYDASTGELEIRNPWGTEPGQSWDTTFEVSLTTLLADGDTITADNIGTKSTTLTAAPAVAVGSGGGGGGGGGAGAAASVSAAANLLINAISAAPTTTASIASTVIAAATSTNPTTLASSHS